MAKLNITNLDFEQQKASLIEYLRSQNEFEDYDFSGSGLNVLIDLLTANSLYNAFYLHMVANEMFLDSAVYRKNVVSRAKAIGYLPTSKRSARATVNITLFPTGNPASVVVPAGTKFVSTVDNVRYPFYTEVAYICTPVSNVYQLNGVELVQGEQLTHRYTIDNDNYTGASKFLIPNPSADISLTKVKIQASTSNMTTEVYKLYDDFNELTPTSKVFFIQETEGLQYEIYFGDGIVGYKPQSGNIVIIDYTLSFGARANKASIFQASSSVGGVTNVKIQTTSVAAGGSSEESVDSIKLLAPLNYQAQNRAVTKADYEVLIKKDYPYVESVRVWGGEENEPKQYGKVFLSLKPIENYVISTIEKERIKNQIIKKRNMVSIETVIVEPQYLYLIIESIVKYKSSLTNDSEGTIKAAITDAIINFGDTNLNKFDSQFKYSRLVNTIDSIHPSIQNSLTEIKLKYRLFPSLVFEQKYEINLFNAIDSSVNVLGQPSVTSSAFLYKGFTCYFEDNGAGVLTIYRIVDGAKVYVSTSAGTVDYVNGKITIDRILIGGIVSGDEFIEINAKPSIFDITSIRNQILTVEETAILVTMVNETIAAG